MPRLILLAMIAICLISGCGRKGGVMSDRDPQALPFAGMETQLRAEASRWQGTPHKMGGRGLSGVDCSGLVQQIYQDVFGIQLPRTASEQATIGVGVKRTDLEPGDLVFFRPPGKQEHVGIYLGGGEFVHASTSRGVSITKLDLHYWQKCYWTARRVRRYQ